MSTTEAPELKVRIPKASKQEQIFGIIAEDEDFRFGRIKVERDRQRYTIPAPTEDDEDAIESVKSFYGVIPYFRKAFFNNQETNEKVEKRELTVLRVGKYIPEQMYISKAGFWNWKGFLAQLDKQDLYYAHVLVKFTAEPGQSSDGKYKFSKPKIEIVRVLNEAEIEYMDELREVVRARVRKYSSNDELDAAEDKYLDEDDKPRAKRTEEEDDDAVAAKAAKRTRALAEKNGDSEDEDEKPKSKKKAAPVEDDEDEEEEKPKSKKGKTVEDDEEEEEEEKPKAKTSTTKSKAKAKDEEEDEKPTTKGKGSFPDLEDDEDEEEEDLKPKAKKGKSVEDDEDED